MANDTKQKELWTEASILHVENRLLQEIIAAKTPEAAEAAVSYAEFLRERGVNSENYPVFLKMLTTENRWVLDALIRPGDPFELLASIPPNRYVVHKCFDLLDRWPSKCIHPLTLAVALGVLRRSYSEPRSGFRLYSVRIADVNNLAKHLDEDKGQSYSQNRALLNILDDIGKLQGSGVDDTVDKVARQAAKIQGFFFDSTRSLTGCLPHAIFATGDDRPTSQAPSRVFVS